MTSGKGGTSGTETSGSGDIARTMELLWDAGRRPSRGPKPTLTLDQIVEAGVRVADAEGLESMSMRRVATELGTGTMSLYRYVPGKAELLDLMLDRVQRPRRTRPTWATAAGARPWRPWAARPSTSTAATPGCSRSTSHARSSARAPSTAWRRSSTASSRWA